MSEGSRSWTGRLSDPAYARVDARAVSNALARLGCDGAPSFREFFERYAGPFAGTTGFELLDIVDQDTNIVSQTEIAREVHGFPNRYLVISNDVANAVLVYDCESDAVYEVDFEGADRELIAGTLEPRWRTFDEFLADHLAGR